eukprot:SAG22_NODE_3192_length_1864_cov_20.852125_3_plen_91_part_00
MFFPAGSAITWYSGQDKVVTRFDAQTEFVETTFRMLHDKVAQVQCTGWKDHKQGYDPVDTERWEKIIHNIHLGWVILKNLADVFGVPQVL